MRLIDADALNDSMYHEAFETDSKLQKWDSGCWIRYKMFENHLDNAPTIDAVPVVRCRECIYRQKAKVNRKGFLICPASGMEITDDDYCSYGAKMESEGST
jgi:hypothetical protein